MDPTFQRKSRLVKNIADNRHFEKRLLEVKFIAPLVFRSLLPYLFCSTSLTLFYFFFLSTWSPGHRQIQNFFDGQRSFEKKKAYKNDPVYLVTFTCSKIELALLIKLS